MFSDSFSIIISYPKVLIPFIWRKPVSCRRVTFPVERKKNIDPNGPSLMLQLARLCYASLYRHGSDLIQTVGPKCLLPFDKIIFPRTNDLYPADKHDNQTRGSFFRNFKQEFLFNGKRLKCLRRKIGPARRLTLPLQKGDWTKWVTLLAEPTFCNLNGSPCCNLNGSPCFVRKCVKRCLFQGSSDKQVTTLLDTNFLYISRA